MKFDVHKMISQVDYIITTGEHCVRRHAELKPTGVSDELEFSGLAGKGDYHVTEIFFYLQRQ